MRKSFAQAYCAHPAASCCIDIHSTSARHARFFWQESGGVGLCWGVRCFIIYLSYLCVHLIKDELENVFTAVKNPQNFISLSIKYFPIKLQWSPSSSLFLKMSVAPSLIQLSPLQLLLQLWFPPHSLSHNNAVTEYIPSLKSIICVPRTPHFTS